jgi:surface carbohydrate biosynthesis protein
MGTATLILPIETKVRELYGKALLALYAAEAGIDVILGDQRVIAQSLHRLPVGIYLDKSISRTKTHHFTRLRNLGFHLAAWCEEGLVYRNKAAYQHERVFAPSLMQLDAFFAWGNAQRDDVLEVVPQANSRMHSFGNPRFDLLRPALREVFRKDAQQLQARFGRYILVNTNFSRFNRFPGREEMVEVLQQRGIALSSEEEAYYKSWVEHLGDVFHAFVRAIPRIAQAFPDHRIVVRPHPSENHERWRQELEGVANVAVIGEGNAIPWMMGADAVIHNACTTGVESFLLDRPTIAYVPIVHETFNRLNYLPNAISRSAQTEAELITQVTKAISATEGDPDRQEKRIIVQRYVGDLSGPLATESIVRVLQRMGESKRSEPYSWHQARLRLLSAARLTAARTRRALWPNRSLSAYMKQKFPDLGIEELQDVLEKIGRARGKRLSIEVVEHPQLANCFVLRRRQPAAAAEISSVPEREPA